MKNHADLSSEDSKQLCKDIKLSKDETSMHKHKDTHSDRLDESLGDEIDDKELKKRLAHDDNHYTKKRKLGKEIYEIIHKNDVYPNSLRPEFEKSYLAAQFRQIKRSLAEQFRQIKRSLAEQWCFNIQYSIFGLVWYQNLKMRKWP